MGTRMAGSRSGSVWGVIPKRSEESLSCRCTFVKPGSCRLRLAMTILTTHSPSTSARHASGSRRLTSRRSTFWRSLLGALGCPIGECWYAFARRIRAFRSAGDGQQKRQFAADESRKSPDYEHLKPLISCPPPRRRVRRCRYRFRHHRRLVRYPARQFVHDE